MSEMHTLPTSGYALSKVYTTQLGLNRKDPDESDVHNVGVGWDWRLAGRKRFEVMLGIKVSPTKDRKEELVAHVVGRFRIVESPRVKLQEFVGLQAIAILLPYARQCLSSLTLNSYDGSYYLPSLDVSLLSKDFDFSATTGAKQLSQQKVASKDDSHIEDASRATVKRTTRVKKSKSEKR